MTQARAILWHMAEGAGTVQWLAVSVPSANSAHFVIELSGRIVQMVRLGDASHSAHVSIDPDDADASTCGGLYSDDVAKAVLGADGWADINRYVVAVEVEGFRAQGPNADQRIAIVTLYEYLRATLPTLRGNLGHRDVQDYKSCPGCLFPWDSIAGHGRFDDMGLGTTLAAPLTTGKVGIPRNADAIRVSDGRHYTVPMDVSRDGVACRLTAPLSGPGYLVDLDGDRLHFVRAASVVFTPTPVPADDCADEIAAAISADRAKARIVYSE